jgi:hypothetical protein
MDISLRASNGWRLREAPFPFQQTYVTPLEDLPRFVRSLLAPFVFNQASIKIETIVFNPEDLIEYLKPHGINTDESKLNRATLTADDASEAAALLEQVLGQWIDFAFVPSPGTFAIYADHDQFTTIFTSSAELLSSLRKEMMAQKFKAVDDWQWTGPHSLGKIEEETNV